MRPASAGQLKTYAVSGAAFTVVRYGFISSAREAVAAFLLLVSRLQAANACSSSRGSRPVQGAALLAVTKPLGLCGERLASSPRIHFLGHPVCVATKVSDLVEDVDSRVPCLVRWFLT